MDKKQVLNAVFGVALTLSIVSVFALFMECANQILFSATSIYGYYTFGYNWLKFALCYAVPMITGALTILFLAFGHFKQKTCLKKAGLVLAFVTAILLFVVSIIAGFLFGSIDAAEYTFIYTLKSQVISACASFAVLFVCLLIDSKTKSEE